MTLPPALHEYLSHWKSLPVFLNTAASLLLSNSSGENIRNEVGFFWNALSMYSPIFCILDACFPFFAASSVQSGVSMGL